MGTLDSLKFARAGMDTTRIVIWLRCANLVFLQRMVSMDISVHGWTVHNLCAFEILRLMFLVQLLVRRKLLADSQRTLCVQEVLTHFI